MVVCLVWIQEIVGSIPTTPTQVQRNVAYWDGAWFGTKSVSRGVRFSPFRRERVGHRGKPLRLPNTEFRGYLPEP